MVTRSPGCEVEVRRCATPCVRFLVCHWCRATTFVPANNPAGDVHHHAGALHPEPGHDDDRRGRR